MFRRDFLKFAGLVGAAVTAPKAAAAALTSAKAAPAKAAPAKVAPAKVAPAKAACEFRVTLTGSDRSQCVIDAIDGRFDHRQENYVEHHYSIGGTDYPVLIQGPLRFSLECRMHTTVGDLHAVRKAESITMSVEFNDGKGVTLPDCHWEECQLDTRERLFYIAGFCLKR